LNDIFGRTTDPIETVTFLKESQPPEIQSQRVSIVDILCEDTLHNRFIIEMQVAKETGFAKRAQYYAAKTYIEQRAKGTEYQDLKEVTLLSIANFELFPTKSAYLSHHVMLDKDSLERDLKDFSFSFLELPKFKKKFNQLITMTEKWAYFFKHAADTLEKDLSQLVGEDLILGRAYEELNRFGWTPEELREYDSIDMKRSADKAVLQAAKEDGKIEGKIEIVRSMIGKGLCLEEVGELTGLSIEELNILLQVAQAGREAV
jgi:predicted transposase/invertase (TIGR01784 family)